MARLNKNSKTAALTRTTRLPIQIPGAVPFQKPDATPFLQPDSRPPFPPPPFKTYPINLIACAHSHYWSDTGELTKFWDSFTKIFTALIPENLRACLVPCLVTSPEQAQEYAVQNSRDSATIMIAFSGGVQMWMTNIATSRTHAAIYNPHMEDRPEFNEISSAIMRRHGHQALSDVMASVRINQHNLAWLASPEETAAYIAGWQSHKRMGSSRILRIGTTPAWQINSCQDEELFKKRLGIQIITLPLSAVEIPARTADTTGLDQLAREWLDGAERDPAVEPKHVYNVNRATAATSELMSRHCADGVTMACAAVTPGMDCAPCLAMSKLNDGPFQVACCNGDLDISATQLLLKTAGANTAWMASMIISGEGTIDLLHCTAPRRALGRELHRALKPHDLKPGAVTPSIQMPEGETVTIARIGDTLSRLLIIQGTTVPIPSAEQTRYTGTRLRVKLSSSRALVENMLGSHMVLAFGNHVAPLAHAGEFHGLGVTILR